jgi:hypothetical protein
MHWFHFWNPTQYCRNVWMIVLIIHIARACK